MEYNRNTPHQGGTNAFKQLTYKEQALSINGTIANLEKAVRYHAKFGSGQIGRKEQEILMKRARQVERLVARLRRDTKK
ncbi:MAG: hypothetical protein WA739_02770 [Candidatus Acidiferrales bacterium]